MSKKIIYFLCTGNSCRSQMAEGFGKKYLSDEFEVYSAGIEAHGLNPKAVKAMNEVSVDITNQTSDMIDADILQKADYLITLCGDANDKCPMTPPIKPDGTGDLMTQPKRKEQRRKSGLFFSVYEAKLSNGLKGLRKQEIK